MSTSTENTKYIATFINIIVILTPNLTVPEGTWWKIISPEDKELGGTSERWAGSWGGRWPWWALHQRRQDVESFPGDKPLIPKMTLIRSRRREVSVFFNYLTLFQKNAIKLLFQCSGLFFNCSPQKRLNVEKYVKI